MSLGVEDSARAVLLGVVEHASPITDDMVLTQLSSGSVSSPRSEAARPTRRTLWLVVAGAAGGLGVAAALAARDAPSAHRCRSPCASPHRRESPTRSSTPDPDPDPDRDPDPDPRPRPRPLTPTLTTTTTIDHDHDLGLGPRTRTATPNTTPRAAPRCSPPWYFDERGRPRIQAGVYMRPRPIVSRSGRRPKLHAPGAAARMTNIACAKANADGQASRLDGKPQDARSPVPNVCRSDVPIHRARRLRPASCGG